MPDTTDPKDNANQTEDGTIGAYTAPEENQPGNDSDEAAGGSPTTDQDKHSDDATHVEKLKPDPEVEASWETGDWLHEDLGRHPAVRVLDAEMHDAVVDVVRFRDETTIHIRPDAFRDACALLRDDPRVAMDFLTDLTAVDMLRLRTSPRFDVVAHLYSLRHRRRLRVKAGVDDGGSVPSLVPLWNGANWMEREAYDMFGIIFTGHPNLKRMLLPDDWDEGHPLRKDYPLRGWKEFPVYNTERTVPRLRTRWTGRGV